MLKLLVSPSLPSLMRPESRPQFIVKGIKSPILPRKSLSSNTPSSISLSKTIPPQSDSSPSLVPAIQSTFNLPVNQFRSLTQEEEFKSSLSTPVNQEEKIYIDDRLPKVDPIKAEQARKKIEEMREDEFAGFNYYGYSS